jgi:hypothetical protein
MIVLLFAILLFASISTTVTDDCGVHAFAPTPQLSKLSVASSSSSSWTTRLHIIGPMIRKMRENANKKNMPMANPDEVRLEAPGKSPSVWQLSVVYCCCWYCLHVFIYIRLTHTRDTHYTSYYVHKQTQVSMPWIIHVNRRLGTERWAIWSLPLQGKQPLCLIFCLVASRKCETHEPAKIKFFNCSANGEYCWVPFSHVYCHPLIV